MVEIKQNESLVYVSFSAEININTAELFISVMAECLNKNVKQVYILFSTLGGTVVDGLNMYHVLKGMPFHLTMHNVGNVDSIGIAIFLAGKIRYACLNSTFMFHGVGFNWQQNERLDQKNLDEKLSSLLQDQKRIGNVIAEYSKLSTSETDSFFKQGCTKDSTFALDKGIINEIREVGIQGGCPMVTLVTKK